MNRRDRTEWLLIGLMIVALAISAGALVWL